MLDGAPVEGARWWSCAVCDRGWEPLLAGSGAVDDAAGAYGRAAKEAQESLKALEEKRALQSETVRLRSP